MLNLLKPQYLVLFALLGCQPVGVPNDVPNAPQPSATPTPVASAMPSPEASASPMPSSEPTVVPTPISSSAPVPSAKPVAFDETFKIGEGQPMVFPDGLILNFALKNDSRCPTNVTCIWAGEVQTEFYFTLEGQQEPVPVTLKGGEEEAMVSYKGYTLTLYAVDPYPVQQKEGTPTAISPVATVKVSTSATADAVNTP
jgi:hypothetical protein